jgi:hypothetical protein
MSPEGGEDAQLFLGMMHGVQTPQGPEPMIRPVGQPVGAVHGHEGQGCHQPQGPRPGPRRLHPSGMGVEEGGEGHPEQGHDGDHRAHVEEEEAGVVHVPTRQQTAGLCRPELLAHHRERDHAQHGGSGQFEPTAAQDGRPTPRALQGGDPLRHQRPGGGGHEKAREIQTTGVGPLQRRSRGAAAGGGAARVMAPV